MAGSLPSVASASASTTPVPASQPRKTDQTNAVTKSVNNNDDDKKKKQQVSSNDQSSGSSQTTKGRGGLVDITV